MRVDPASNPRAVRGRRVAATLSLVVVAGCGGAPGATAHGPAAASISVPVVLGVAPDVASVVARVSPAVVSIIAVHALRLPRRARPRLGAPSGWGAPAPSPPEDEEPGLTQQGQGSGFIIDAQGHVVTNAHVVEGAVAIHVKLADDRELEATVRGQDAWLDVAVLEVHGATDLPSAPLGGSAALRVGEYVLAIGNPYGLGSTVTMGILSAKSRDLGVGPYDDFLQTDASINPGNSGGPLFDLRGLVIGINTAIHPRGHGLGFAIPIDDIKEVLPQLLAKGRVDRGRLGVMVEPLDAPTAKALGLGAPRGAWVTVVEKGSPAERAGLRAGDLIVDVDGAPIVRQQDLQRIIARHTPGAKASLGLLRRGSLLTVDVTLGELRANVDDSSAPAGRANDSDLGARSVFPASAGSRWIR